MIIYKKCIVTAIALMCALANAGVTTNRSYAVAIESPSGSNEWIINIAAPLSQDVSVEIRGEGSDRIRLIQINGGNSDSTVRLDIRGTGVNDGIGRIDQIRVSPTSLARGVLDFVQTRRELGSTSSPAIDMHEIDTVLIGAANTIAGDSACLLNNIVARDGNISTIEALDDIQASVEAFQGKIGSVIASNRIGDSPTTDPIKIQARDGIDFIQCKLLYRTTIQANQFLGGNGDLGRLIVTGGGGLGGTPLPGAIIDSSIKAHKIIDVSVPDGLPVFSVDGDFDGFIELSGTDAGLYGSMLITGTVSTNSVMTIPTLRRDAGGTNPSARGKITIEGDFLGRIGISDYLYASSFEVLGEVGPNAEITLDGIVPDPSASTLPATFIDGDLNGRLRIGTDESVNTAEDPGVLALAGDITSTGRLIIDDSLVNALSLTGPLDGQIIINAANSASTWDEDITANTAATGVTLAPTPYYDDLPSDSPSFGQGAVGLAPFSIHYKACVPFNGEELNGLCLTTQKPGPCEVLIAFYGPVTDPSDSGKAFLVERRLIGVPTTDPWTDVSADFVSEFEPTTAALAARRFVALRPIETACWLNGYDYRITPRTISSGGNGRVACVEVQGTPSADDSRPLHFRVKASTCTGADLTTTGSTNGIPDGFVNGSDFTFFLQLFAAEDPRADLTTTGSTCGVPDEVVNGSDFTFYLGIFAVGCPE